MPVSKETAVTIALAHREIETAEKLLVDIEAAMAKSSMDQKDIRDAFGRRQDGLQLGVPTGSGGHRLFNVPFVMCRPIIEAHIANQRTIIDLSSEAAAVEIMGDRGDVVPTAEPINESAQKGPGMSDKPEALTNAIEAVEEGLNMLEQIPDDHHKYGAALDDAFDRLEGVRDLLNTVASNITH